VIQESHGQGPPSKLFPGSFEKRRRSPAIQR
jgi:hypothetical protein